MNLTEHFELHEFACHDGTAYPAAWIQSRLMPLCTALEALLARCGARPVRILSGYRSPGYNEHVGGAKQSQHMEGRAADIAVEGLAPSQVYAIALAMSERGEIEIGGLGLYPEWIHIDVRPRPADGHLATWQGEGVGGER